MGTFYIKKVGTFIYNSAAEFRFVALLRSSSQRFSSLSLFRGVSQRDPHQKKKIERENSSSSIVNLEAIGVIPDNRLLLN